MKQYTAMKNAFQKKGWAVRFTSVAHVRELKEEIASRMRSFDKGVYRDHMSHLRYDYKETIPGAASVIIIAPSHLPALLHFQYRGKSHHIPIPPTYVNIRVRRAVNNTLQKALPPYRLYKPKTPIAESKRIYDANGLAAVWCCIENILLSLAEHDVYGATVVPQNTPAVKEALGIPQELGIAAIIPLGYKAEGARIIPQKEVDLKTVLHTDRW